jgi:uncharacterized coiled-coil protein SlyX
VFSSIPKVDTRMAVLEEKFNSHEKMMDKLESAIQTISEINQNISKMLTLHEEKIDSTVKSTDIIFGKFKRLEDKNSEEHQKVMDKLEKLEESIIGRSAEESKIRQFEILRLDDKISGLSKFRWLFAGGLLVIVTVLSHPTLVVDILTSPPTPSKLEQVK